ncbi:MAG TPA: RagB/SusD family nutrient uptake outer membrane protein [Gemmatimonadales bacterium]|nr:RagB/SusD family nutrient uptake outer membrane protein [Gemmatimonadales bacterium]
MNRSLPRAFAVAAGIVALLVTGCTDPSVDPVSTVGENQVNNPAGYRAYLAKLYGGLQLTGQQGPAGNKDINSITDEGFSSYLRLYWEAQELPTDEALIAWGDADLPTMNFQTWGSVNQFISGLYARVYYQISLANDFLRFVPATYTQYRAEARFLRALSYWHVLDLWGAAPIVTAVTPTPPQPNTRQEVYDFVVSELQTIRADLPAAGPGTYGLATQEADDMLLATVYLNAEVYTGTPEYTLAMTTAAAVINSGKFSLDPVFHNIFTADNNRSPEIIFPVVQDALHSQSYGGVNFIIHAECGGSGSTEIPCTPIGLSSGGGWWGLRLRQEVSESLFANSVGDGRMADIFTSGRVPTVSNVSDYNAGGFGLLKFSNLTSTGAPAQGTDFVDTDFPMFRLAGAYLIYAEAAVRTGTNLGQALTYVNDLRERAYGSASGDITAPQLTLDFILKERGRELLWEAHRRTDLIRFGKFSGNAYVWTWKNDDPAGAATPPYTVLYPVPSTALAANPFLQQNPGY